MVDRRQKSKCVEYDPAQERSTQDSSGYGEIVEYLNGGIEQHNQELGEKYRVGAAHRAEWQPLRRLQLGLDTQGSVLHTNVDYTFRKLVIIHFSYRYKHNLIVEGKT
jgi:hypothetical protein